MAVTPPRWLRALRWSTLRIGTGAWCAIVGALMLMAPEEFGSPFYAAFQRAPIVWGTALFLAGATLIAAGILRARSPVTTVAHAVAAGVLILFGASVAQASPLGLIYAVLGLGTLAALTPPALAADDGAAVRGDGLSVVIGINLAFVGAMLTWRPPWLPAAVVTPYVGALPAGAVALALIGAVLALAQVRVMPWPARFAVHVGAGIAHVLFHLPFLGSSVWPARVYWIGLGVLVAAAPWLGPALDRVRSQSVRVRLSVLMALLILVPFVGIEAVFHTAWGRSGPQHAFSILVAGAVIAIIAATWFATWLTRPLRGMTERMRRQAPGVEAIVAEADEVETVAAAFDVMMRQLEVERTGREAALDAERTARARAEQLQMATAALAITATPEEAARVSVTQGRSTLGADAGVVLVMDEETGSLRMVAADGFPADLHERWRDVSPNARLGVAETIREQKAIWMRTRAERVARYPHLARSREVALFESWIFLPLFVKERAVGSVSFAFVAAQPLDAAQRAHCLAFAGQCAIALERTRSRRAEQIARLEAERARRRTERLQSLTAALGRAARARDVVYAAEELSRHAVGAKTARVYLASDDGTVLTASAGDAAGAADPPPVPLAAASATAEAARHRIAVWLESRAEIDKRYPHARYDPPEARHEQARVALPLATGDQRLGALVLGFAAARAFDADDRAMLLAMAQQTAQALARTRQYEREHAISERLQRSLLPADPPAIPGFSCAVRYVPAAAPTMKIGGDWYDVFALPRGRVGIAVGDVAGHGLEAAALMGQLRVLLRAYALEGHTPDGALDRLNRLVDPKDMVTLIYLVLDPISGRVEYASAGHCPPVVVEPGKEPRLLRGNNPPIAGVSTIYRRYEDAAPAGSTFVLYTDGLIEIERSTEIGLSRLRAAAARAASLDVEAAADAILADVLRNDMPRDDAALVLFRLQPVDPYRLRVAVPAQPESLRSLRWSLQRWLAVAGVSAADADEIVLATGEAATNVVEHAYGPHTGPLELIARQLDDAIEITVRDAGTWRPPREEGRGKGFALMRATMDTVDVRRAPQGTLVRMERRRRRSEG